MSESRRLALEIEGLLRIYNTTKSPATWQTILEKKGRYKALTEEIFHSIPDVAPIEKQCLVKLFKAFRGFSWAKNFGWTGIDKLIAPLDAPVPYLDGITTELAKYNASESVVYKIELTGFGCCGDLLQVPLQFPECTTINLSINAIRCSQAMDLRHLPHLQILNLSCNQLCFDIGQLYLLEVPQLEELNLSNNNLYGKLPSDLFMKCTHLERIDLSCNRSISGHLPELRCPHLHYLNLASNRFEGCIPTSYSALSQLKEVVLTSNRLIGDICTCYAWTALTTLALDHNTFTGEISESISALQHLQILYLHSNALVGTVPDSICSLSSLKRLDLSSNNLQQRIPADIGRLTNLEVLRLVDNAMTGPIPISMVHLRNLKHCQLFRPVPAESTTAPTQFDIDKFLHLCGMNVHVGVDSFSCTPTALYGQESTKTEINDEIEWLKTHTAHLR